MGDCRLLHPDDKVTVNRQGDGRRGVSEDARRRSRVNARSYEPGARRVAQGVELRGRDADLARELAERVRRSVRPDGPTERALENVPAIDERGAGRKALLRLGDARRSASIASSGKATMRTRSVFVVFSAMPARVWESDPRIVSALFSRSTSVQRRASSSPRRAPQPSARRMNGPQRVVVTGGEHSVRLVHIEGYGGAARNRGGFNGVRDVASDEFLAQRPGKCSAQQRVAVIHRFWRERPALDAARSPRTVTSSVTCAGFSFASAMLPMRGLR